MIDRICISISNQCNMGCRYCHFREKGTVCGAEAKTPAGDDLCSMDLIPILDHVKEYGSPQHGFKIGFVGNGEPFLEFPRLRAALEYLEDSPWVSCYTITNGTIVLADEDIRNLDRRGVNVGFSLDGPKDIHDALRCGSWQTVMENMEHWRNITGHWPTFNATVGREVLADADRVIGFFEPFRTRVTFSRMVGKYGISLEEYRKFLAKAEKHLQVRRGGSDCTMYGGTCGAGINNFFFADGFVYLCGNWMDMPPIGKSDIPFTDLEALSFSFDRHFCWKEMSRK